MESKKLYDSKKNDFIISSDIDYDNCMRFYLSENNMALKEYITTKTKDGSISMEEVDFWNGAIELGLVKSICRTAIVESHTEDRTKDPLKVKLAKETLKSINTKSEKSKADDISKLFSNLYMIGYTLKEIITKKKNDKNTSVEDILNNLDKDEMMQKGNELYERMKSFATKFKDLIGIGNSSIEGAKDEYADYYKTLFSCKLGKVIDKHEECQMEKYVEMFQKEHPKSNIETFRENVYGAMARKGTSIENSNTRKHMPTKKLDRDDVGEIE